MPPAKRQTGTKRARKVAAKKVAKKRARNEKALAVVNRKKELAKKRAVKRAKDKALRTQENSLTTALRENPGINSQELAFKCELQPEDVIRYRHFIHEYLKDFNPTMACMRMGYQDLQSAKGAAKILLLNPYTQLRLSELMSEMEAESLISGGQVLMKLWQESNLGNCGDNASNRISALKELAKIKQLGAPVTTIQGNVSGVMLVPVIEGADPLLSWEDRAKASQAALKSTAIDV